MTTRLIALALMGLLLTAPAAANPTDNTASFEVLTRPVEVKVEAEIPAVHAAAIEMRRLRVEAIEMRRLVTRLAAERLASRR